MSNLYLLYTYFCIKHFNLLWTQEHYDVDILIIILHILYQVLYALISFV